MAVGSVNANGETLFGYHLQYREVAATERGGTLAAHCPGKYVPFCTVPATESGRYRGVFGGTSSSTANVAGVAGLLRAYHPSLNAAQTRARLIATSWGPNKVVDADWAIRNIPSIGLSISGPAVIEQEGQYGWTSSASGGEGNFAYSWKIKEDGSLNWTTVSTSSSYSRIISEGDPGFTLWVEVASNGRKMWKYHPVDVDLDTCGGWGC